MSSMKSLAIFAFAMVLPTLLMPSSLAESKARSDLGNEVALLGETTQIPITLSANDEQIVATENEIIVPSVLSFVGAELGKAGEAVSAEIHTQLIAGWEESKDPKLIGLRFFMQGYAILPGANPANLIVTNGIEGIAGN